MKQHWVVMPIDMKYDERAGVLAMQVPANAPEEDQGNGDDFGLQGAIQAFAEQGPPQAARRRDGQVARVQMRQQGNVGRDNRGNPVGTLYGYKLDRETQKQIDNCFETPALAERYATELASKNPGKQFGVFTCVRVFETTQPQVITKKFTETGELALDMGEQQE